MVLRVGIIIAMKREDTALSAISAVDSSQTNFTTQSGEIKAGCLPAARNMGMWLGGWCACTQLVTFVRDTVHVRGKHFTCCTDVFHICVRSCLLTRQSSVKAPSERC